MRLPSLDEIFNEIFTITPVTLPGIPLVILSLVGFSAAIAQDQAVAGDVSRTEQTPVIGYNYDSVRDRAEIDLDTYMSECRGLEVNITIASDRNDAVIQCRDQDGLPQTSGILTFIVDEIAVTWRRSKKR